MTGAVGQPNALIDGLTSGNADKVHAAAEVLTANAADVASNMLPQGSTPPATGNGIPAQITTVAEAGTVFNDATTKLIGGVYDGNRQSIHDDLAATQQGLKDMVANGTLTGAAAKDAGHIVALLGQELSLVDNTSAGPNAAAQIHQLHASIINIVQHDATLAAAATQDGAAGFMALPPKVPGGGDLIAHGDGHGGGHGPTPVPMHDPGPGDHLAQIFQTTTVPHTG